MDADREIVIPALLRAARRAYGYSIGTRAAAAGFDDLPRNGPFLLGGMANYDMSAGDLIRQLGVSKQAASQLIDTLVVRGYLERNVHPDDRRRMTIELTERGRAAADVVQDGIATVDAELARALTPDEIAAFRSGLEALWRIGERMERVA